MRGLLFAASFLVLLAGIQLFGFTDRTNSFFAFTVQNPLSALFLGAGYIASIAIEALAGRQRIWANARIAVPAVFVFTVLTLTVTLMHLGQLHLGSQFALHTRVVACSWLAIYVVVPILLLIVSVVQLRTPGADPPRSTGVPSWTRALLGMQAIVLFGFGIALFAVPGLAAPLWPWKLTTLTAQAIGAWLIALGVAAAQALYERDARRLRPAALGYVLLAVALLIALARYPRQFAWGSASGILYLIFLTTILVVGTTGLACGLSRRNRQSASTSHTTSRAPLTTAEFNRDGLDSLVLVGSSWSSEQVDDRTGSPFSRHEVSGSPCVAQVPEQRPQSVAQVPKPESRAAVGAAD